MHYAIYVPNCGSYSDPHLIAQLAQDAETAGWDGFFLWDHIGANWPHPIADPWINLAAIAMTTRRIKLGPLVTPLPRRRPWKLARETVTLDHLSKGRLILGVGIGDDRYLGREYSCFGESMDDKLHGVMLDEGLEVLMGLWSGKPFSYSGKHYHIDGARFLPTPLQVPHIPIWVGGRWPNKRPFCRAARWDGAVLTTHTSTITPNEVREMVSYIRTFRLDVSSFDIALSGRMYEWNFVETTEILVSYAEAGLTWWLEYFDWENTLAEVHERIRQGPPRV